MWLASNLSAASAAIGSLNATSLIVAGSLTATNFTLPFSSVTAVPTTLGGYGIGDAYTKPASDARYSPVAGSTNVTTLGAVTTGSLPFANLTGAPTTLGGYGIDDAYTKTASDARYSPVAGSTNVTTLGAVTMGSFPFANLSGNPLSVAAGKTLSVANSLTLAGTDGATLNMGAGGTLGSAAFAAASSFLSPAAIGSTVQAFNSSTTTLGNSVNAPNALVQTDGNGALIDSVLKLGAKTIYVSKSLGNDTRTGLSKYSVVTPFATLTAAVGAAVAGDTIVAQDGAFTDKNMVLSNGVNWFFMPAATIAITGAANGDVIFKDGGTPATVTMGGCGQTFSLLTTTASTSISGVSITALSNVTLFGISLSVFDSGSNGIATGLSCSGGSLKVTMTGDVTVVGGGGASGVGYGVYFGGSNGGTVIVSGNVTGNGATNGYGCYATGTTGGLLLVTQRIIGATAAVNNSTASTVTCGQLIDTNATSLVNNHLTLNCPLPILQPQIGMTTGFNNPFLYGPQDTIMQMTASGTLASGTVTLPADNSTRVGQRLTIMSSQTITALTVSVASGTIYGWSNGTLSPGSITFEKLAANLWTKL